MSNETDTEIAAQTTPEAGDSIFQSQKSQTISTPELNALSASVSSEEAVDPITKAIREEILQKQRDILREYLADSKNLENLKLEEQAHKILIEQIKDDEKFREFLKNLKDDEEKRKLVNAALNNPATKEKFEAVEIAGYKKVHTDFKDSFKTIAWDGDKGEDANKNTTQSQKITNDVDGEICTLTETTHKTNPISVTKSDGTEVKVNSYRTIDFPVKLNGASGNMHLSIVALDENGNRPPIDKAVYFTAHYEEGPNGKPLLKEVSSPMPIKFIGEGKDAIGYVEHGGKIYTMPVTRGKYEEMMQEVALNKGQGVNLSQTVQEIANDKVMNMSQEQGDKSIVDGYKAISEKYADLQKNPEGKLPEELSKEGLKDKKAFIQDLSNNNNSLSDKDKVVILEELIKYETNRGEKVIGDGKIAINETLEMLNTEKGILKERIVKQDKEKETAKLFSELPFHGLTAEEMQKDAPENKEKETAKLFSGLPLHGLTAEEMQKEAPENKEKETVKLFSELPSHGLTAEEMQKEASGNKETETAKLFSGLPLHGLTAEEMQKEAPENKEKETVKLFSELPSHGLTAEEMQKEASGNKETETAKLFSELPSHGLTAEEMQKEAPENKEKETVKLFSELPSHGLTAEEMQKEASGNKETETAKHFSELPSHGLTAEEMQKEASGNKEKETAKLFSELPFHGLTAEEMQKEAPENKEKETAKLFSELPSHGLTAEEMLKEASGNKEKETAEHFSELPPHGLTAEETQKEAPVSGLPFQDRKALDAEMKTVSTPYYTSDSKNLQQVEEQAAQLMANLGGSSSSRSTEGESTKQKLHAATKDLIDKTRELVDQIPDSKVIDKADSIKNILSSSAPIYPKEDQKKQIIDEYNKQNTIDEKKYFIEDKIVSNKDLSKEERLGIIDKLIILEVNERYSKLENVEVTKGRILTAGQVETTTEQTELQKVQNQQGEKAIRQTQVETVNTPNNVGIITGLNEAKIKINSEDQSLSKSAITKQGHIR